MGDALLTALFTESPIGLHILDTGLRLVYFNSAARHIQAFPIEELLGCTLSEALSACGLEEAEGIEALVREVLETGTPRRDVLVTLRSPYEPYAEVTAAVSWFRLNNARGRPLGVATVIVDVTERYQAQARLALLHRVSTRIGTTLDVFQTAQELAEAAVPDFADTTTVDLLDPVLRGEAPEPGPLIEGIALRRAGWHSMHDIKDSRIPMAGEIGSFPAGSPYRQAMADLRPCLISKLDADAAWLADDPFRYRLLTAVQVRSMIVVPLCARGLVLGLACFYRWRSPDAYEDDDLALAKQLAAHTALCLDNARLYSRGRSAARILQMSLRPLEAPTHSAVEIAHCYPPSSFGGDWADVIPLPGARVALAAGTVTGDGIRATAAMGELRAAIGALAALNLEPDELLQRLHELVTWLSGQEHPTPEAGPRTATVGATCTYAIYDPVTRHCTLSAAGHQPPVFVRPDGTVQLADTPQGPALGQGRPTYQTTEHELPKGTVLILTSAAQHNDRTPQKTTQTLAQVQALFTSDTASLQETCNTLMDILTPQPPEPGATLLLAKTRTLGPEQLASWTLQPSPEHVAQARKYTADQLAAWNLNDLTPTTELVVSELVTNALRYSNGTIGLRLIRDQTLTCEVSDTSSTAPQLRRAEEDDEGGRGLFLTGQLTQRWGTRPTRHGKIIWAEQALPEPVTAPPPSS
ncbi:SpoIIE family protein phosphatase (plasmid) [Streptomyces sp. NBC_01717]|uniref:SpoIIE family protein phosphatase n=1 Tax=Streptomyces sp. NBC_01717 TaxID=2975918 RepID=UPI002E371174|nr:SpoIIE family protein phosphatase [Streptomyces sp. NBC_01717]